LVVSVYDKDLREQKLLFDTSPDTQGFFAASCGRKELIRGDTARLPALLTTVSTRKKDILYASGLDDIIYEATSLSIIDIQLTQRPPSAPTADDFTQMVTTLDSVLPPVKKSRPHSQDASQVSSGESGTSQAPQAVPSPQLGERIRLLREDDEARDLSYLTRLKTVSFSKPNLTNVVLAHRLAESAQSEDKIPLPPELFYAILATDTFKDISAPSAENLGQADLDLATPIKPLLYQLALLDDSVITSAVGKAVASSLAPPTLIGGDYIRDWHRIRDAARDWLIVQPTLEDQIWDLIQDFLESGKEAAVRGVLAEENIQGDLFGFIERLIQAFSKTRDTVSSQPLAGSPQSQPSRPPMDAQAAMKKLRGSPVESLKQLAEADTSALAIHIAKEVPDANITHEHPTVTAAASQLEKHLAKDFPTLAFRAKLRRQVNPGPHVRLSEITSPKDREGTSSSFGAPELGIDARAVSGFLDAHEGFDLQRSKLESFLSNSTIDTKTFASLAKVQRIFKVAPTFETTQALLDEGLHSATQIASVGRPRFIASLAKRSSFTVAEAEETYARAANVKLAASLITGNLQGAANALRATGVSEPLPPARLEALFKEFPNIASLFNLGDICACSECMTVYSPSAYLVDVLEFLGNRYVLESIDGPDGGRTARDVLFKRRQDLAELDLSCDNTNVTLPLIDLVCELLEDVVAPDGLSPGTFSGTVTKGKISTELLQFLRDELKLPFTANATVSDEFNGGYRTVRDKTFVVSLSPNDQKVRVLRQTYGDAAALSASPTYVNAVAYERLANSTYLPTLPFNLFLEECRAYLKQLGVPRIQLMKTLAPDAAYNNALEALGFSPTEGTLITNSDENGQEKYWNTGDPATIVSTLKNVLTFVNTARIEYTELQALINATAWLNPPAEPPPNASVEAVGVMFIKHKDSTCTLKEKDIEGLDIAALDRLHRFLRLWKALLRDKKAGWTVALLDRFIIAPKLGTGELGGDCLVSIKDVGELASQLSGHVSTSIEEVVNIFAGLPLQGHGTTYGSVFLNTSANGPLDSDFELRNIALNDSDTPPPVIPKLSEKSEYISRCLSITSVDTQSLIELISKPQPDSILTLGNLSIMYAVVSISRRCNISVAEYGIFSKLSSLDPLSTTTSLSTFASVVSNMQSLELSGSDLDFLTQPPTTEPLPQEIPDATVAQLLTSLQLKYAEVEAAVKSPFDDALPAAENQPSALDLLAQIKGISQLDLSQFQRMLIGELNAAEGSSLITAKLHGNIPYDAETNITQAQGALAADPGSETLKKELVKVLCGALSDQFALLEREKALGEVLQYFGLKAEVTAVLLDKIRLLKTLLDKELATGNVTKVEFPLQYMALYLLHKLAFLLVKIELSETDAAWLLDKSPILGWADLRTLPVDAAHAPVSWELWLALVNYLSAIRTSDFPMVENPENKTAPFTLNGLFDLVLNPESELEAVTKYLSKLLPGDEAIVSDLLAHFGYTVGNLRQISQLRFLESASKMVRKSGLETSVAIALAETETPDSRDVASARDTLKSRYTVQSDWLDVLKTIQDPLRIRKRDGLIDFILAFNKATLTSAKDISELLLMDVEMGAETLTSRIIQAHQSVQQFAQRLLMGLEPTPIAGDDPFWSHWTEMSQYRVWEANKKVFLYPEMWIEPELRDNKSELFVELEEKLKKEPMTPTNVELVVAGYLNGLEHIADLEVMSTFYEVPVSTLHVFARTKGGDPRDYYHRTLVYEADWSPWERLADVGISGHHLLSFKRNNRLTVAWPTFTLKQDPVQQQTPPSIPDPNNLVVDSAPSRRQRLKIQLSISTKNPDTGKWSTALMSQDGVMWPGPGDIYAAAETFPEFLNESISLQYIDLEGNLGQLILVCENTTGRGTYTGAAKVIGIFNLAGCKGYPEPFHFGLLSGEIYPQLGFLTFPQFRNTSFVEQRFRKSRNLATTSESDLAIRTMLDGGSFASILGTEYGRFAVTHPTQLTVIDRAFVGLQMYSLGKAKAKHNDAFMASSYRAFILPQGTFLPYFVNDSSTRGYFVLPGYESSNKEDTNFRTASDTLEFFNKVIKLVLKWIDAYYYVYNRNIKLLRQKLNEDEDYQILKKEFLSVYFNAEVSTDMKFRAGKANLASFYHPLVCLLKSKLYNGGMPELLARKTQLSVTDFDFKKSYDPQEYVRLPYPQENLDFSLSGPYSGYNWELFFHLPFQIAAAFSADRQFEAARNWYHYIFNPQGADLEDPSTGPDRATAPQKRYWHTNPFFRMQVKDYTEQLIDSLLREVTADPKGFSLRDALKTQIQLWRTNPFAPHVIAHTRPVAYQMAVVLKYIQNLIEWGDQLFTQLTRETITQASTLYMVAEKLLGPKPRIVPPAVPVPARNYQELSSSIDLLGNALLRIENLVPDLGSLPHHGQELPDNPPFSSLYFGIPPNTKMLEMWDLVADRLFKIRHSQDINGNFVSLALTSPPIDPGALVRALASGASLQDVISGLNAPLSHYRFGYMLQRAQSLTETVVYLGGQLLGVLQKRDEEGLARLHTGSELTVLKAVREVKILAIAHNKATVEALSASRAAAEERKAYYEGLAKAGLNADEKKSLKVKAETYDDDDDMHGGYIAAEVLHYIPNVSVGIAGFGGSPNVSASYGGSNPASAIAALMSAKACRRSSKETTAQLAATAASYIRRGDDWGFQKRLAEKDIAHIDKQIAAANVSGEILKAERDAHDTNIDETATAEAYLRSKFTNTELFEWAVGRTSATYFQAYQLAFRTAKRAERCLQFELGDFSSAPLIKPGYWDSLRSGLLAGEELQLDLGRLEVAHTERHARELELTKSVSLAQLDPIALLALRTSGKCIFSLPETIFDLDHPGHYFRRTKTIAISIPCVVGPFTSVSATLRLLSSRYRARPTRPDSYAEAPGGDDRFVYNVTPPPVMTGASSAANDAGVHDLHPDDPRYLPFEYSGVLGTYALELPPVQQFDYASVADAILTISYTARDGGSALRTAATPAPVAGAAGLAMRTAFPVEWNALKAGRAIEPVLVSRGRLPHWAVAQGRTTVVKETVWCAVPVEGVDLEDLVVSVADTDVVFEKAGEEEDYWKGTLAAGKVKYGEKVKIEWKDEADPGRVGELICVVSFDVKEPTD
jgi:hypothetical protein